MRFISRAALAALAVLLWLGAPHDARAQAERAETPEKAETVGENLRVFVLTMGPGDHPFFKFGHNAIAIEGDGRAIVYNFGTFDFGTPNLIPKFLKGRLEYWLSRSSLPNTLLDYQEANRSIYAQELDLSPADKVTLERNLDRNAEPQNRKYLYDYFWDNCSTRVRDAIDVAAGGRVRAAGAAPGGQTFRAHALRMTADFFWVYLGLDLGLGSTTDGPLDRWKEAFLPQKLRELLRDVRIPAEGGGDRPLVKEERVVFEARRAPLLERPPAWTLPAGAVGLVIGGGLAALGRSARRRRGARVALGVTTGLLGLVFGLLGVVLIGLWAFTNHRAAYANENILQLAPWALALPALAVPVARGRARAVRMAFALVAAAAALSLLGAVAKVLPGWRQDNGLLVALLFPIWVGWALALRALGGPRPPSA